MAERRNYHGYADYARDTFRPSDNVEVRRRGLGDHGQRWAIRTQLAENELNNFSTEMDAPYSRQDVGEWLDRNGYKGLTEGPWDMDQQIYNSKLARAAGVNEPAHGPVDTHTAYPEITEGLHPQPPRGGYMDYNGGKEPFADGGLVQHLLDEPRYSENVEDRRAYPGDMTLGGLFEGATGLPFANPLLGVLNYARGMRDDYGIDPDVDRILKEMRLRKESQTPPVDVHGQNRRTDTRGRYFVDKDDETWGYYSSGGNTPSTPGSSATPSGPRSGKYATGGLVGGMEQVRDAADDGDLVEPAMFMGRAARRIPYLLKGETGDDLLHEMRQDRMRDVQHGTRDSDRWERELWNSEHIGMNRDQQLMFEADDSGARLLEMPDFGPDRKAFDNYEEYSLASRAWQDAGGTMPRNMVLGDMLHHPELYEQYPDLKSVPLKLSALDEGHHGALNTTGDKIDYMTINRRLSQGDMLDTILHETQHGIQTKEGWTRGTNPDDSRFIVKAADRAVEKAARVAQAQKLLAQGQDPKLLMSYDLFKGVSPMELGQILHEAETLHPDELQAIMRQTQKRKQLMYPDPFTVYQRNEGESMARNTSERRPYSPQARREIFWKDSEDRQGEPRFVGSDSRIEY